MTTTSTFTAQLEGPASSVTTNKNATEVAVAGRTGKLTQGYPHCLFLWIWKSFHSMVISNHMSHITDALPSLHYSLQDLHD